MNIFRFEVKRLFKSCLIWSLVCGALVFMFMAFFPSMMDSGVSELVQTKLGGFPNGLMEAFGLDDMIDFRDIIQYLAYTIQYVGMAGAIYAAMLGVNALYDEEADGTIEFLYAQPISRREIVLWKMLSRLFIFYLFIMIVGFITMASCIVFNVNDVNTMDILMDVKSIFIGLFFSSTVFMALGFGLSTVLKRGTSSTALSIGMFFITYIFGILAKMRDSLKILTYLSPFDYAFPRELVRNGWNLGYVLAGFIIILFSIISTFIIYNRKDMKI